MIFSVSKTLPPFRPGRKRALADILPAPLPSGWLQIPGMNMPGTCRCYAA
ncbi:hypothetical protein GbCGDNIH3_7261 [Granulibacter bethesdensis]|uniref:Uncharacterized protein n=1 Tax=Granulibacter bethesdensis TaxID=364410 RepID=A0AAN0REQ3_9PROT|nr:hypothetical protein GbCGDNIH3_7261 [Granulibacter bethesdensis]